MPQGYCGYLDLFAFQPSVDRASLVRSTTGSVHKRTCFTSLLRRLNDNQSQCGDVLYLEHEVGGHWYILRAGTISFYVSVSPLETQSEVLLMRSLSDDGHFGLTPVLLNVLNRLVY